jgi:predicted RecA/RadA family phage recombinase
MATNRRQNGRRITADPGGTVASGDVVVIGDMVCVALVDGVSGTEMEFAVSEVYALPKLDAAVIAAGESVAWETKGATVGETIEVLLTPGTGSVS